MTKEMNWDEMIRTFPNEWVALADYKQSGATEISGTVIAHNANKKTFHQTIRTLMPTYQNIAVRYTGQLVKNPDIPLLWQITHTD